MTDQELLYAATAFCLKHTNPKTGSCRQCPLNGHICISKKGNLILGESDNDDKINFVKFTEEFRNMIKTITDDKENGAII